MTNDQTLPFREVDAAGAVALAREGYRIIDVRFAGFRVDAALLTEAPEAVVMHCLPAHRGEQISDEALDGPRSVVLDQAENRLYVQQALLVDLLT